MKNQVYPSLLINHFNKSLQRQKAYDIVPYPGFGLWGFTRIHILERDPIYKTAVARLVATAPASRVDGDNDNNNDGNSGQGEDVFLDLGCGLGQNIRQLVHAGVPPGRLVAVDLRGSLMELGFELFRDRDALLGKEKGVLFITGDVLANSSGEDELAQLDGKVSIVHAANLFHLFGWREQVVLGKSIVKFMQVVKGSRSKERPQFVFGRQVGSLVGGARVNTEQQQLRDEEMYLHNEESFQRLWNEVGVATGTQWRVEVEMLGKMPPGYEYMPPEARYTRFVAWRVDHDNE